MRCTLKPISTSLLQAIIQQQNDRVILANMHLEGGSRTWTPMTSTKLWVKIKSNYQLVWSAHLSTFFSFSFNTWIKTFANWYCLMETFGKWADQFWLKSSSSKNRPDVTKSNVCSAFPDNFALSLRTPSTQLCFTFSGFPITICKSSHCVHWAFFGWFLYSSFGNSLLSWFRIVKLAPDHVSSC